MDELESMAYYATLRKPSKKQKHYRSREAPAATPCSLSQQSVSSVSMFDLRGEHRRPVRPAPLPPNKSLSEKKHGKGGSIQTLTPTAVTLTAEQPSSMHQQTSFKFLRMRKKLEARLTGCPTNSDDEGDEERGVGDQHQPPVCQPRSQTLPRKLKLSTCQSSTNPSKKPPVYVMKGPARKAPPPPKATKKLVYRKCALPSTNRPPPPVPTRQYCHPPAPPPPSTATIPTKRSAPPPPLRDPSRHHVSPTPSHSQTVVAQPFQPIEAVPVYNPEMITDTATAKLKEPRNEEVVYSQVKAPVLHSKAATSLGAFSPMPMPQHSYRLPAATMPPLLTHPTPPPSTQQADDNLYDIPGYISAASTIADTGEDDYTSMDAISSVQPRSYVYSEVSSRRNNLAQKKGGDTPYTEVRLAAPHLPPLPSKLPQQPSLGRVPPTPPPPPPSTTPTVPDVHKDTGNGQIYASIADN